MIQEPSVEKLIKKIGSRYGLCVVASKRARQLIDYAHNQGLSDLPDNQKALTLAAIEIASGKITAVND